MIAHLGLKIRDKKSNHINKELYLSAKPEGMPGWTEESYARQIPKASLNFDMNMRYFESLDADAFAEYILTQTKKYKMKECSDLNELADVSGVYMMVLDFYKQVYIGITNNIKRRIVQHWHNKKSLERLIFGNVCDSILSIDSFGALDTTRVFYINCDIFTMYELEEEIVKQFDIQYLLNRTAGGIGTSESYTDNSKSALLAVLANKKTRQLAVHADINELRKVVSESDFQHYLSEYPELKSKL